MSRIRDYRFYNANFEQMEISLVRLPYSAILPFKLKDSPFRPLVQLYASTEGWVFGECYGDEVSSWRDPDGGKLVFLGQYFGPGVEDFYFNNRLSPEMEGWIRNHRKKIEASATKQTAIQLHRKEVVEYRRNNK